MNIKDIFLKIKKKIIYEISRFKLNKLNYANKKVLNEEESNKIITKNLKDKKSFFLGRLGETEARLCYKILKEKKINRK